MDAAPGVVLQRTLSGFARHMQHPRLLLSTGKWLKELVLEISVQLMVANTLLVFLDCTVRHMHVCMHLKPTINIGRNRMRTGVNSIMEIPISGLRVVYEVGSAR